MLTIKICGPEHLEQAVAITKLKNKHSGVEKPWQLDYAPILQKYLNTNTHYLTIGAFDGDELVSFLCSAFWRNNDPSWFIVFLFTKRFGNQFSFNRPEIGLLLKAAFEIAEYRHYWKYYYSIAKKHETVYDMLWKKNNHVDVGKYNLKIEQEVPAYTAVDRDRFWRLVGSRVYEVDMVIKSRILKVENRIQHESLHPLELETEYKNYDVRSPQLEFVDEANSIIE
jgi:hypothetical protein